MLFDAELKFALPCQCSVFYRFSIDSLQDSFIFFPELYTSDKNIVEVAESLSLSEFANLMKISGLVSELQGTGERYTAFVPSNQAFSSLKPETLQELKSNKEILRETLLLHIASGKIVTEVMKDNQEITALDGSHLRINAADEGQVI